MAQTLVLPTKPIPRLTNSPENMIIYSKPKAGKTTQLAKLENNLIIDLEKGTNKIDAMKVQASNLTELFDIIQAIKKSEHVYDYISVDTISRLEEWCEWDATKTYMKSPIGKKFNRRVDQWDNMVLDEQGKSTVLPRSQWKSCLVLPKGAGYLHLRNSFKKWLFMLMDLAPKVIFVAHLKDASAEINGKEVATKDLALTGMLKTITAGLVDAIGYVYWEGDKLMISFQSQNGVEANARCEHLKNASMEFDWDSIYID